jgi:hypothetical protein
MGIQEFDTEEELEDAFEENMERMQEEARLKDAICEAEYRVGVARDEWMAAEEELKDLRDQLDALGM